jgi:hypothetical protein
MTLDVRDIWLGMCGEVPYVTIMCTEAVLVTPGGRLRAGMVASRLVPFSAPFRL